MKPVCEWMLDKLSRTLEPELQHAVIGDVTELKLPTRRAVWELLALVVRRQALPWREWGPWLALFGIVGPVIVLLSRISVGVVIELGRQAFMFWRYGVPYSNNGLTNTQEFGTLFCFSVAIICWSWLGGFVLAKLSGKALNVNETLFYLIGFVFCGPLGILICLARLVLSALHLLPLTTVAHDFTISLSELTFFVLVPLTLEMLFIWLPSLAGMRQARRGLELGIQRTSLWAAAVATLTVLTTWMGGWQQSALAKWSEGKWNPGGPSWPERLVPLLVLSWPVLYLLATATVQLRGGKSVGAAD
ncbi:MAG: hypothetical protein WBQ08_06405 [Candidatus Sulfotelmatobacter sp.]